jgi:hypothetical protein
VQLAVHSRTAAPQQHATLQTLFSSQQQQQPGNQAGEQQLQQPPLQEVAAAVQPGQQPCTVEPQQHSTDQPPKEVQLSERKLSWHEQQQEASAPSVHEANLPAVRTQQQQQQQQQQHPPECWDELDLDSISLLAPTATTSLAPPSSPGGASSSSSSSRASFSMLGADREVWLVRDRGKGQCGQAGQRVGCCRFAVS